MLTIVIFGASGDLASKKTFPSLWRLFLHEKLPQDIYIVGYSRSKLTKFDIINKFKKYTKEINGNEEKFENFLNKLYYISGLYDNDEDFKKLKQLLDKLENNYIKKDRIYYLTLPPNIYILVCKFIKNYLFYNDKNIGWNRIVIEKPFGTDLKSSIYLSNELSLLFSEECIYRIDHYLGKEMVQNLIVLRFANRFFEPIWNKDQIKCVLITLKEDFGCYGRGGYYDKNGVIRDFFQNHLIQLMTLVAMETPKSLKSFDVIDEKIKKIDKKNVILGQYIGSTEATDEEDPSYYGYKDDPLVEKNSKTPTFASIVFYIENERWQGKALNEKKGEIRIQFKDSETNLFENCIENRESIPRNEFVIRLQPNEAIYNKFQCKIPGLGFQLTSTELELTMREKFIGEIMYDAYEKLILDIINGSHLNFVRNDESEEAWKLFTPLLQSIENNEIKIHEYTYGSRGPKEADELAKNHGFKFDAMYKWTTETK